MNNLCTLPKNMQPNREAFEALGFHFPKSADNELYWASLPAGWKIQLSNPIGLINLVDETDTKRALYDYKHACMSMC